MYARMNDNSSLGKRQGHRAKRTALSRVSQLFGHGSAFKLSSSADTSLCRAVAAPVQTSLDSVTATKVTIVLARRVAFGDRIAVVGETEALGCWQPCNGVLLQWGEGDVWSGEVCLQPGSHEFKCVTVKPNGQIDWENGGNRVIKVPSDAGGALMARCEWSATQHTALTATPDVDATGSKTAPEPDDGLLYRSISSGVASLWSGDSAEEATAVATVSCSPKAYAEPHCTAVTAIAASKRIDLDDLAPGGPADDSTSSSCSDVVYIAARGALDASKEASVASQQSQLIPHGSYSHLGPAVSSEDLSVYTYNTYNDNSSSSSVSDSLSPETSFTAESQQPLISASLAAAAAAAAAGGRSAGSTEDYSISDSVLDAGADQDSVGELPHIPPMSVDISPLPHFIRPSASILLSPISTTSTRPLFTGAAGGSLLSISAYSSMEVSDMPGNEELGTVLLSSEEGLADVAASLAAVTSEAAAAAGVEAEAIDDLLGDPLAFEQLMAVEPAVLAAQQQQQMLHQVQQQQAPDATQRQSAHAGDQDSKDLESVFLTAGRYGSREGAQEILKAAGAIALGEDVDAAALLPPEDTLPPAALAKFAAVPSEVEVAKPCQQHEDDDVLLFQDDAAEEQDQDAARPLPLPSSRSLSSGSSPSSFNSSTSSNLTKDDLPCLGLTVTVPSPAEKAAETAAVMSAANADAAAAVAAAKPKYDRCDDCLFEPPVAQEGLRLVAAAHIIPHVDKTHTGGEDAYFISPAGHGAVGVSDGVSAWAEDGIDPGEYSRTLAQYCSEAFEERVIAAARAANNGSYVAKFDPRAVLRYAQQCTCKPGSATVVLAALQPGGKLHVANLGDCGVKVVRNGRIVHETQPQQHDFNLPYQLSHPRLFPDTDTADSADRYTWDVQEGDVIVAASDGLFDNLWDDELLTLLPQGLLGASPSLDSSYSLTGMDSFGRSAGKKLLSRSRSFAALTRSSSNASTASSANGQASGSTLSSNTSIASAPSSGGNISPANSTGQPVPAGAVACGATAGGSDSSSNSAITRSRSTSQLATWGAKQLRSWGKSKSGKVAAMAGAGYSLAEDGVFSEAAAAAIAAVDNSPKRPATPAEVSVADVTRAAELLAAAAAAHAADKEFKSPWSVAAGKAYGLLARLFAKGGKMDDITCVVAVVQDAQKAKAIAEAADGVESSIGTNSDTAPSPVSV